MNKDELLKAIETTMLKNISKDIENNELIGTPLESIAFLESLSQSMKECKTFMIEKISVDNAPSSEEEIDNILKLAYNNVYEQVFEENEDVDNFEEFKEDLNAIELIELIIKKNNKQREELISSQLVRWIIEAMVDELDFDLKSSTKNEKVKALALANNSTKEFYNEIIKDKKTLGLNEEDLKGIIQKVYTYIINDYLKI